MKTNTKNSTTLSSWTRLLGAMLTVAFMVPAVAFSQPPTLDSPADIAIGVSTTPTLSWFAAGGDSVYHLQVDTSNVFGTTLYDSTLTGISHRVTGLRNATKYYWRVNVTKSGGATSAYSMRSFTTWNSTPPPSPPLLPVTLGLTAGFAILSATGITDVPTSTITGDVGVSPTTASSMTFNPATTSVVGTIYGVDAFGPAGTVVFPSMLTQAKLDLTAAYNDAAGRSVNPIGVSGNLGGQTLYSGLYKSTSTLAVTSGNLTLDAQGDSTAVWIFQIASGFNMTDGRQVILSGGAKASNIFWQVGSAATFGSTCVMKGTIMAHTSVTFVTGGSLEGRALAQTGNVTLQQNTVGGTAASPIRRVVFLGSAANFTILAGTAINSTGSVAVTGDIGVSPSTVINGFPPGTLTGVKYPGDATSAAAQLDLKAAYDSTSARTVDSYPSTILSGQTLGAGVYAAGGGTFSIIDTLKLSGSASDVFIFKMTGWLNTGANSSVTLLGGAQWSNVFWQCDSATIDGDFKGTILADSNITQKSGASIINGRLLARKGYVTVNGTSVLPVELVAFTATANRMNADLHWSTATEVNNYGFEIERRLTATWAKVGFVSGAGTSNSPRDYSYTDNNLSAGRYTYRLKQVDNNGAFSYHGSVEVVIGLAPQEFALLQNYPNPFNPSTVISYQLPVNSQVTLKVYDVLGKEVATLVNGEMKAGSYTVPFSANSANGSTLASGVYIYRLNAGTFVSTKKLILMK
jgi:Ice-binding-like/Secretion system C-terminal sorting domain